ncbi:unnamed protein product [Adineta steineri]|uniref:Polysaccharide lyase 14 domain-containing protein n=1 Tax=Adineta steineri TaxID=433720 RepID=A0A813ZHB1_9BILA|nr:unnamed protein product [Adineta steineri]CAF3638561.1 unnamed protein product [Adineta steineri]CAF3986537.1 unnamed protein product [Adineta steineri]
MMLLSATVVANVFLLILINSVSTQLYSKTLNWDNYGHQQTYTDIMARSDFGSVTGWVSSRAMTSGGRLRVTVEKNALSGAGGLISNTRIPDGTAYELGFDIQFHSQFDWSRGGKVGFGLGIGNGNTGCNLPTDGAGGTLRLMWYNNPSTNRVYFHPYIYHQGMPGPCGSNFGKSYPTSGSIEKGRTYKIHMYVKSNTGNNANGHVQLKIDGQAVIDQSIRWTTNDSRRFINNLSFHTFRGGKGDEWKSGTDGYIYYDNLYVRQISK